MRSLSKLSGYVSVVAALGAGCAGQSGEEDLGSTQLAIVDSVEFFEGMQGSVGGNGNWPQFYGEFDATIYKSSPGTNYGNDQDCVMDGGSTERACLLRWDFAGIPGATVNFASIVLDVHGGLGSGFNVYKMEATWLELQASWTRRRTNALWQTQGAKGANDRNPTVLGTLAAGDGVQTVTLNAAGIAAVQAWVNDPLNNKGLIIAGTNTNGGYVRSAEYPTVSLRPKLRFTYTRGSGTGGSGGSGP